MYKWGHLGSLLPLKILGQRFQFKKVFLESITQEINVSVNGIGFILQQALISCEVLLFSFNLSH